PRGDRFEDRRGAALLPDVARTLRGRSGGDDRLRLRRADHEGAAARVRGRDEPPDPASDGRVGWLISAWSEPSSAPVQYKTCSGPTSSTARRSASIETPTRASGGSSTSSATSRSSWSRPS